MERHRLASGVYGEHYPLRHELRTWASPESRHSCDAPPDCLINIPVTYKTLFNPSSTWKHLTFDVGDQSMHPCFEFVPLVSQEPSLPSPAVRFQSTITYPPQGALATRSMEPATVRSSSNISHSALKAVYPRMVLIKRRNKNTSGSVRWGSILLNHSSAWRCKQVPLLDNPVLVPHSFDIQPTHHGPVMLPITICAWSQLYDQLTKH